MPVLLLLTALLGMLPDAGAAMPLPQDPAGVAGAQSVGNPQVDRLLGRTVRSIRVVQQVGQQLEVVADESADAILRGLRVQVGAPLELRAVTADIAGLWHERRIAVNVLAREAGEEVDVFLFVEREVQVYERIDFQGMKKFSRGEVNSLLGLVVDRQVTSTEALAMRNILIARYRREGHAFCSIDLKERDPDPGESTGSVRRKILTFRIDEGPKVTVDKVMFQGNVSFGAKPAAGFLGAGDFLLREAHIKSSPASWWGKGGEYSREILEEDVDRLKLFYRSRGFLDAEVSCADVRFSPDLTTVDLDFVVAEGPRYRIREVRVRHVDEQGEPVDPAAAFYAAEAVAEVLESQVGEYYDHTRIRRDQRAIEDFYGERGHPSWSFPGMGSVPGAFRINWPKEVYDDEATVALTFDIVEGTPKTLQQVLIRGNAGTRDDVIRRKIYAMPGELLDMKEVDKSIRYLEATRFFQEPYTLAGPKFELMPAGSRTDALNLAVDVQEGETGELRWGVGISTGAGAQASMEFKKRNFDITDLPSSWNPLTVFNEVVDNKAFHGGGQNLDLLLAPGTQISQFRIGLTEPHLFGDPFTPYEGRVSMERRIRRYSRDGYTTDTLGGEIGLSRRLTEFFDIGGSFRQETINVEDPAPDATVLVFDAEGQTEMRGVRLNARYRDLNNFRRPTSGFSMNLGYQRMGGFFGGEENFWRATLDSDIYVPLRENDVGHSTVLHFEQYFGLGEAYGDSDDLFLTERFFLGGPNLRGFEFRGVGPSQFGRPLGGEAIYYNSLELGFPLVATRLERDIRDRELLRGVAFLDFGLLGLSLNDPTFREPRLSYGFGLRISVPLLEIPIALDLAWPILYEETDDRRQFYFSIAY
jgi:outer membrane protein insertion porin family